MSGGDDLELIPRGVRDKLDRVGIRLHLRQWQAFSRGERMWLRDADCWTDAEIDRYRRALQEMVLRRTGGKAERMGGER